MGGVDFARYGREKVPAFLFWLGTVEPEGEAKAARPDAVPLVPLPLELYRPLVKSSIRARVLTMSMAVLNLLG